MREDMTGQKFGRWTVMSDPGKGQKVLCRCSCGTDRLVFRNMLRRSVSTSCGCYHAEMTSFMVRRRGRLNPINRFYDADDEQ